MTKPRKFIPGECITSLDRLMREIRAGHYIMVRQWGQTQYRSVHPGWAASWQFRMVAQMIEGRRIYVACPNRKHPDNQSVGCLDA